MGQLASTLGVVPGTATTMVEALSESGLAHYEPYAGRAAHRRGAKSLRRWCCADGLSSCSCTGSGYELDRSAYGGGPRACGVRLGASDL